jgi:hypothetical protein
VVSAKPAGGEGGCNHCSVVATRMVHAGDLAQGIKAFLIKYGTAVDMSRLHSSGNLLALRMDEVSLRSEITRSIYLPAVGLNCFYYSDDFGSTH